MFSKQWQDRRAIEHIKDLENVLKGEAYIGCLDKEAQDFVADSLKSEEVVKAVKNSLVFAETPKKCLFIFEVEKVDGGNFFTDNMIKKHFTSIE